MLQILVGLGLLLSPSPKWVHDRGFKGNTAPGSESQNESGNGESGTERTKIMATENGS